MKMPHVTLLGALILLGAGCSSTSSVEPAADGSVKSMASSEGMVCKSVKPTGSRIAERVCATQEQWDRAEQESKERKSDIERRQLNQNPDGQ